MRRGAKREVRVGDDFEALERGMHESGGAGDGDPGDFHLRECGDFGEAAESEGECERVCGEGFVRLGVEGEVEEDFVGDEGEMVFQAESVKAVEFFGLHVGTGGVVGMNEKDGAGARGDGAFEGLKIDEPALGVLERVWDELDVLKAGEKFEQRVAGFGEKEFVTGICKQAENVGVGFAGAGGEEEGFGVDGGVVVVEVVAGDLVARGKGAFGLRVVLQGSGVVKGGEDGFGIVAESALRRIGSGEVEKRDAAGAEFVQGEGEAIGG